MCADVLPSIELPVSIFHQPSHSYPKDVRHCRPPILSKQDRHARALQRAVLQNDCLLLESLLDNGICPDLKLRDSESKSTTALHLAVDQGKDEITSLLLSRDADCDVIDGYGHSPLDIACKKRRFTAVKLLINHGASLKLPSSRVNCLGLAFYHLMNLVPDMTSDMTSLSDLDIAKVILDCGFARGWNGINCSYAYLNRVYNRHKDIFLVLLQASSDVKDEIFMQSCFGVLYRRRDAESLLKLHRYGHSKMAPALKRTHKHTEPGQCRLEILSSSCPLMALCRVKIRQNLREKPGRISEKIDSLTMLPECIKRYLHFME